LRLTACGIVLAIGVFIGARSLRAHHSDSAEFDVSKRFTLAGTLTKVEWVNPHVFLYVTAQGSDGAADARTGPGGSVVRANSFMQWKIETNPPAWFKLVGVKKSDFTKSIGRPVTVEGNRAKNESRYAHLLRITFADGSSLDTAKSAGQP
jgi:hypothetical protein